MQDAVIVSATRTAIGRAPMFAFFLTLILAVMGKGTWRVAFIGWVLSLPATVLLLFTLEFD